MNNETTGKEALFGALRDENFSPTLVNRLTEMAKRFEKDGGTFEDFIRLDKHKLAGMYNKMSPTGAKGIGAKTYRAFDRLVYLAKMAKFDARQVAKATVEEQERREAERARMREELLGREMDFDAMTAAMAALGTLGLKACRLGKLLEMHDMAKGAKPS